MVQPQARQYRKLHQRNVDAKSIASVGYGPLYFASAVLADGKLVINGGEYNFVQPSRDESRRDLRSARRYVDAGLAAERLVATSATRRAPCSTTTRTCWETAATASRRSERTGADVHANGRRQGGRKFRGRLDAAPERQGADGGHARRAEFRTVQSERRGSWSTAGPVAVDLVGPGLEIGPQVLRPQRHGLRRRRRSGHNAILQTKTGTWSTAPNSPRSSGRQLECQRRPGDAADQRHGHGCR